MEDTEKKFYNFYDILTFLGFNFDFKDKRGYPFNRDAHDVNFSWGQILIPKAGIRETVQNKISDIEDMPLNKLTMMYQIPFTVTKDNTNSKAGIINQNITLTFRYDKTFKYGEINKSIYECCFYILEHGIETNDFFIITDEYIFPFFSYYIIDNQWGLGAKTISSNCSEKYFTPKNQYTDDCINCGYLDSGDKCTNTNVCHHHEYFTYDEKV